MKTQRTISKKLRFEIFKRDDFKCIYCGKGTPDVTLEIDHILPVSKGGTNDINNLVTACFDCNRGKTNIELKTVTNSMQLNMEILKEREKQYKEYQKILKKFNDILLQQYTEINNLYSSYNPSYTLKEEFLNKSVKMFINAIGFTVVYDAMERSCTKFASKYNGADNTIKYFCGICWRKIKELDENKKHRDEKFEVYEPF
jgi:hypothetical protein